MGIAVVRNMLERRSVAASNSRFGSYWLLVAWIVTVSKQ
jgi:hypothetical protein